MKTPGFGGTPLTSGAATTVLVDKRFWIPFVTCTCCSPLFLWLAISSGGAGHGDYGWAKVFFPYTMFFAMKFGSISPLLDLLAIVQFPVYGTVLGLAWVRNRFALGIAVLGLAHCVFELLCYVTASDAFRNP